MGEAGGCACWPLVGRSRSRGVCTQTAGACGCGFSVSAPCGLGGQGCKGRRGGGPATGSSGHAPPSSQMPLPCAPLSFLPKFFSPTSMTRPLGRPFRPRSRAPFMNVPQRQEHPERDGKTSGRYNQCYLSPPSELIWQAIAPGPRSVRAKRPMTMAADGGHRH